MDEGNVTCNLCFSEDQLSVPLVPKEGETKEELESFDSWAPLNLYIKEFDKGKDPHILGLGHVQLAHKMFKVTQTTIKRFIFEPKNLEHVGMDNKDRNIIFGFLRYKDENSTLLNEGRNDEDLSDERNPHKDDEKFETKKSKFLLLDEKYMVISRHLNFISHDDFWKEETKIECEIICTFDNDRNKTYHDIKVYKKNIQVKEERILFEGKNVSKYSFVIIGAADYEVSVTESSERHSSEIQYKGDYHLLVTVTEGCWNCKKMPDISDGIPLKEEPYLHVSLNADSEDGLPLCRDELLFDHTLYGAIAQPLKFFFPHLTENILQQKNSLKIELNNWILEGFVRHDEHDNKNHYCLNKEKKQFEMNIDVSSLLDQVKFEELQSRMKDLNITPQSSNIKDLSSLLDQVKFEELQQSRMKDPNTTPQSSNINVHAVSEHVHQKWSIGDPLEEENYNYEDPSAPRPRNIPLLFRKYVSPNEIGWLEITLTLIKCPVDSNSVLYFSHNGWEINKEGSTIDNIIDIVGKFPGDLENPTPYPVVAVHTPSSTDTNSRLHYHRSNNTLESALLSLVCFNPHTVAICHQCYSTINYYYYMCKLCNYACCLDCCKQSSEEQKKLSRDYKKRLKYAPANNFIIFKEQDDLVTYVPYLWINNTKKLAMVFQNIYFSRIVSKYKPDERDPETSIKDILEFVSSEIFVDAWKMGLALDWNKPFSVCVEAISICQKRLDCKTIGDWNDVKMTLEEQMQNLLEHIPVVIKGEKYYHEITQSLEEQIDKIKDRDLLVFSGHDSVYSVIKNGLNKERSIGCWPFNMMVSNEMLCGKKCSLYYSPRKLKVLRSSLFVIFLMLLSYHIFFIDRTQDYYFVEYVGDTMGWSDFDDIKDVNSYWDWFQNTFIPGIYGVDNHTLLLVDSMLLRQVRLKAKPCDAKYAPNNINEVPACYINGYSQEPWFNITPTRMGRSSLISNINANFDESYNMILPTDKDKALGVLQNLNESWIDWSTQAVIIEFFVYSPNAEQYGVGSIIAEFAEAGRFVGSHAIFVFPKIYLSKTFSWHSILLFIYFIAFLFEELWDFVRPIIFIHHKNKTRYPIADWYWPCTLYLKDIWNWMDFIMFSTGTVYLFLLNSVVDYIPNKTLDEAWTAGEVITWAQGFCAFTVIVGYFRLLYYLLPIEGIGILVYSIFEWGFQFMRWIGIFLVVEIGFSCGFHILYSGVISNYTSFFPANIFTFIQTFTGYSLPDYTAEPLGFFSTYLALIVQLAYVIVNIILLLNLLIALLSAAFDEKSTLANYRHLVLTSLIDARTSMWPAPLNLLQIVFTIFFLLFPKKKENDNSNSQSDRFKVEKYFDIDFFKRFQKGNRTNKYYLYSSMVEDFFREEVEKDKEIEPIVFPWAPKEKKEKEGKLSDPTEKEEEKEVKLSVLTEKGKEKDN